MGKHKTLLLFLTMILACTTAAGTPGLAQSAPVPVPPECRGTRPADPSLLPVEIADLPVLERLNSDLPVWTQGRLTAGGQLVTDGGLSVQVHGPTGTLTPGEMYKFTIEMALGDGWTAAGGATGIPLEIWGQGSSGLSIVVSGDQVRFGEPSLSIDGEAVGKNLRQTMLHILPVGDARTGTGEYIDDLSLHLAQAASPKYGDGRPTARLRWESPRDIRNSAQVVTTCFGGSGSPEAMDWAQRIVVTVPVAFDSNGRHTVTFVPDLRGAALTIGLPGTAGATPGSALEYRQQITVKFDVGRVGPDLGGATAMLLVVGMLVLLGAGLTVFVLSQSRPAVAAVRVVSGQGINQQASMRRGQLTIGRDPRCEMALADPQVSARHALIQQAPRGIVVTDLESENGTFVNGQRTQRAILHGGELLRVGQTELRFLVPGGQVAPGDHPEPAGGPTAYVAVSDGTKELTRAAVTSGTVLGRHAGSPLDLRADPKISRHHAQLQFQAGQWAIRDMDSRNGTFVNGRRVTVQTLQDGDQVHLGDASLRFISG